jgi:hypothetical protein
MRPAAPAQQKSWQTWKKPFFNWAVRLTPNALLVPLMSPSNT